MTLSARSVLSFWFDSAQHGEMIVDAGKSAPGGRYVSWESETGGDTWMVRAATGKLPSLKNASPQGEPGFRIRPVGDKSYQIEKRAGDSKWETLASLEIEVASCKLKPATLREPPPVTEPVTDQDAPKDDAPKDYVEELKLGTPAKTTATPSVPPTVPPTGGPVIPKKEPGV